MGCWVEPDTRDDLVKFVDYWSSQSVLSADWFCNEIDLSHSKLVDWRNRQHQPNKHNGLHPKSHWLNNDEREKIISFYHDHEFHGYRRCAYMMIDQDVAYASPSTVWRVLTRAGVMRKNSGTKTKKGNGFEQPTRPHQHWHTDISYVKVGQRFYFLMCVIDGYSRYIVHWDLREDMSATDVCLVQQRAIEKYPEEKARMITDNGKQYTGIEFGSLLGLHGLTHVRTSAYYPQSNGKVERFHGTIKSECIRRHALTTRDQAKQVIHRFVSHYHSERLHSAIGYITPKDKLNGNADRIHAARDEKLDAARLRRRSGVAKQRREVSSGRLRLVRV